MKKRSDATAVVTSDLFLCYTVYGAITQEAVSPLRRDCDPPMT